MTDQNREPIPPPDRWIGHGATGLNRKAAAEWQMQSGDGTIKKMSLYHRGSERPMLVTLAGKVHFLTRWDQLKYAFGFESLESLNEKYSKLP